nr:hypothetical protein [Comamonas koreensis]
MADKHFLGTRKKQLSALTKCVQVLVAALPIAASAASSSCIPDAPNTQCLHVTAEGANQTFIVPAGITSVQVRLWGAGGGGIDSAYWGPSFGGAGGGFASGTVSVTPGETLNLTVGQGGTAGSFAGGTSGTTPTFGGGGAGGFGIEANGSSGGGMSALWRGAPLTVGNQLLIAGGGGGGSNGSQGSDSPDVFGVAGGGGGSAGGDSGIDLNTNGAGGTQVAGGAAATDATSFCSTYQTSGTQFQGGTGGYNTITEGWGEGGGGGGGGWFGGGGGRCHPENGDAGNGGGGGGSAFIAGAGVTAALTSAGTNASTPSSGGLAANVSDTQYVAGVGTGGADTTAGTGDGGSGLIVIQWREVEAPTPEATPVPALGGLGALLLTGLVAGAAGLKRKKKSA